MHFSPDDERAIRKEFDRLTNRSQAELRAWLDTSQSKNGAHRLKGARPNR